MPPNLEEVAATVAGWERAEGVTLSRLWFSDSGGHAEYYFMQGRKLRLERGDRLNRCLADLAEIVRENRIYSLDVSKPPSGMDYMIWYQDVIGPHFTIVKVPGAREGLNAGLPQIPSAGGEPLRGSVGARFT